MSRKGGRVVRKRGVKLQISTSKGKGEGVEGLIIGEEGFNRAFMISVAHNYWPLRELLASPSLKMPGGKQNQRLFFL